MLGRSVRLSIRNMDALFTALLLPIMLMLLFVYLFGGAIQTGTEYVTYVVPGVIVLCAGFGSSLTAVAVTQDMNGGIMDRFRSMDISAGAVLGGHVVASIARNLLSTVLVLAVGFLIGFRPEAGALDFLAAFGVLFLYVLAFSWVAAAVGVLTRSAEAANGFTFFVMFLPYPSSAFVPVETMPTWIHGFAENQPMTPIIESMRALLLGTPMGNSAWLAAAWCAGILVAAVATATFLFRRRIS
ncbi:ABC transporter permease [Actinophytocola sp. S1-96]|uniref:Transport permease protein n=2 Tax=Actinophytocola gossypii TaxID=2812003 RepID=A0ABT2JIV0_9PSEU|nr:ABC transporter permease [Actinophytocola gossypii]